MADATFGKVDSVDFAIYLNKKAKDLKLSANVTQIQKWLYCCYGLYLVAYGEQLLTERPKAWNYGPAFPRVHKKQKKNNDSLDGLEAEINLDDFKQYDDVVEATLKHFGDWTAGELVAWTHEKGTAWDKQCKDNNMYVNMKNQDIFADFKKLFKAREHLY